jgi:hypothetical protein
LNLCSDKFETTFAITYKKERKNKKAQNWRSRRVLDFAVRSSFDANQGCTTLCMPRSRKTNGRIFGG